jgi:hypothetical protein
MGGALKKLGKNILKLTGKDTDANKKAAKIQADAIKQSSEAQARDSMYAAQAAQNQIEATAAQNAARQQAQDLLGRPMETATVDLSDGSDEGDDLLGRRRGGVRAQYRNGGSSNSGLVVR